MVLREGDMGRLPARCGHFATISEALSWPLSHVVPPCTAETHPNPYARNPQQSRKQEWAEGGAPGQQAGFRCCVQEHRAVCARRRAYAHAAHTHSNMSQACRPVAEEGALAVALQKAAKLVGATLDLGPCLNVTALPRVSLETCFEWRRRGQRGHAARGAAKRGAQTHAAGSRAGGAHGAGAHAAFSLSLSNTGRVHTPRVHAPSSAFGRSAARTGRGRPSRSAARTGRGRPSSAPASSARQAVAHPEWWAQLTQQDAE
jgi:hypothetical protein